MAGSGPGGFALATVVPIRQCQFSVGELVHHRRFNYRGVVADVDPEFRLSDEWYETVARSRPPRDRPWYHVLVDGSAQATYVAERHLERDHRADPITHPMLGQFFSAFENGRYRRRDLSN